jgi:uncharacterized protein YggE
MHGKFALVTIALLLGCTAAVAQQASQVQLKIEASNRTLTVSADGRVTTDPEIAILHIGFETQPSDAKTAYAAGAKTSNDIVAALKQAGIPDTAIRSESQHLNSFDYKTRKFKLVQKWTVKTPPERAAEILDIAIAAGATNSGEIEWTVKDEKALEDQALEKAAARARSDAEVLAKGMGVHLGALVYVTNQISASPSYQMAFANNSAGNASYAPPPQALAIEPRKVSREATVYAVFAIE